MIRQGGQLKRITILTLGAVCLVSFPSTRANAQTIPLGTQCNGGGRLVGSHRVSGALGLLSGPIMTGTANQIGSGFWTPQLWVSGVPSPDEGRLPLVTEYRATSPNPFGHRLTINYTLSADSHVEMALFDIAGRRMRQLANGMTVAGPHFAALNGEGLPSGVFFCRLVANGESQTIRIVHLR